MATNDFIVNIIGNINEQETRRRIQEALARIVPNATINIQTTGTTQAVNDIDKADRERYITIARAAGYTVVGYYFRSSIGESLERNAQRTGKARVPNVAVASIHAKLELPDFNEGFVELYYVHIGDNGFIVDEWRREGEG